MELKADFNFLICYSLFIIPCQAGQAGIICYSIK